MIKRVRTEIIPQKLPSFTSTTVLQQLTGCEFDGSMTASGNFDVFFRSLTDRNLVS